MDVCSSFPFFFYSHLLGSSTTTRHPLLWSIHWMETLQAMTMVPTVAGGIHELEAPNATPLQALPLVKTQARIVSLPPAINRRAARRFNLAAFSVIRVHLATNAHRDVELTWILPTRMTRPTLHRIANKVHVAARPREKNDRKGIVFVSCF
jgi:hypothetical protein